MKTTKTLALLALLAMGATLAWAQDGQDEKQDPPKDEAAAPAAEQPAEDPAMEEEEEELPPEYRANHLELVYSTWWLKGNQNKYRQYATPVQGFSLHSLEFISPYVPKGLFASFQLAGAPWEDYGLNAYAQLFRGRTTVELETRKREFFDRNPVVTEGSENLFTQATVTQSITPNIGAWLRWRRQQDDANYVGPKEPDHSRTRSTTAGLEGQVGPVNAGVVYNDLRFYDRTRVLHDSVRTRLDARLGVPVGNALNLEGTGSWTAIEQTRSADSHVQALALNGDWTLGPKTYATFSLGRDKISLPNTLDAYTRERFNTQFRLVHRYQNWTGQFGYRRREVERVRADQQFADAVKFDSFDFRLSGRLHPLIRASARYGWEHSNGDAQTQLGTDLRRLYWDDRALGQLKLEGGGGTLNGYLTYTYRYLQNTPRRTEVKTDNWTLGAGWIVTPKLDFFAEFANEKVKAKGPVEDGITLDYFFPGSTSATFGANFAINEAIGLSANYTQFVTHNSNPLHMSDGNVRGRFLTTTLNYEFGNGSELSLTWAPWYYRDRLDPFAGYDTRTLKVGYSVKF